MIEVNHECYVSFEVAKLLKEAGFDWGCRNCYEAETKDFLNDNEGEFNFNEGDDNAFYSAPTLDVAQRWLREVKVKDILLYITPKRVDREWKWNFWYIDLRDISDIEQRYSNQTFSTYEEALEAGEKKVLEIILEKGE